MKKNEKRIFNKLFLYALKPLIANKFTSKSRKKQKTTRLKLVECDTLYRINLHTDYAASSRGTYATWD